MTGSDIEPPCHVLAVMLAEWACQGTDQRRPIALGRNRPSPSCEAWQIRIAVRVAGANQLAGHVRRSAS